MCKSSVLKAGAILAALFWATASQAAFFGLPRALKYQLDERVHLGSPVLPPIGHSRFCLTYPDDCQVHSIDFRHRNIELTMARWNELNAVNREVNRSIEPYVEIESATVEQWRISPALGDCKDYAVTKRHELLKRGWPSRALLLSEVIVPTGEHHLILVVRTKAADLVLDNLNANIRPAPKTYAQYQWVRMESPQNPMFWNSVNMPAVVHTVSMSDATYE
jgi:predicted transglutaminase-like cysteine proteinase